VSITSPRGRYPPLLQITHWLIGLFVVCQLTISVLLGQLRSLQYGQSVLSLHRQLGFAILVVSFIRLAAIVRHRVPSLDDDLPSWQIVAARLLHYAFYVALMVQPVLGMCVAWARGDTVTAFGLVTLPAPWDISDAARDRFMTAHVATAMALVGLVLIHLGAVIFNHWFRRVPVMERMLPSAPSDQLVNRIPVAGQMLAGLGIVVVMALATGINAVAKYRSFTQMTAAYQETGQAEADETRAAQAAWKEVVGIAYAGVSAGGSERLRSTAETARGHLESAASHASTPDSRAAIASVSALIAHLDAQNGSTSNDAIGDVDAKLQDLIDAQAATAQQVLGDIAERASRGHDLIVVTVAPMTLLGVVLALLLARSMLGSVGRLRALVRGIETNEGSRDIVVRGRGEFAQLMRDMISMRTTIENRTQAAADQRFALEADRVRAAEENQAKQRESERCRTEEHQLLQRETEQRQAAERRALREQLAEEFESHVASIVDSVAVTVDSLKSTAANLAHSAASTTKCSSDASVVAESTKDSASRIASSSAQLSGAAQSVRKNAEQSKARAVLGVQEASAARAEIDLLAAASGQISSIAELISGVTRQTNLLAINARIEAARAGDAGRGFCIVADEVKTLAAQTQSATDGIGDHVHQVGSAATRSIEILQNMRSIIADLEGSASIIFAACDDQFKSTEDIASKVTQISASTVSVAANIAQAERTARATEAMAADVVETAEVLQRQADSLQDQVANFVLQLRSVNSTAKHSGAGSETQQANLLDVARSA
jgi:methyl-accepting chemotaxis protein/cytochrome b561